MVHRGKFVKDSYGNDKEIEGFTTVIIKKNNQITMTAKKGKQI